MNPLESVKALRIRMSASIIGQESVVESLLIALLANGNILMEGLPGLAKTRAVKSLAKNMEADFSRIQFTPDLLPSDITGSEVLYAEGGEPSFRFEPGPIFANIVLADEINRAPAKVQAALLEAMEERQVTVSGSTHRMPDLFMVMATQNPIEQEGTYPLPEAQMDRFLMHVYIDYPDEASEGRIIRLVRGEEGPGAAASPADPICFRCAPRNSRGRRQRTVGELHRGPGFRHPLPGALRRGTRALDTCGGQSTWRPRPGPLRPSARLAGRPGPRAAGGRARRLSRGAAAPAQTEL
jgi:MoxR-like ATPase